MKTLFLSLLALTLCVSLNAQSPAKFAPAISDVMGNTNVGPTPPFSILSRAFIDANGLIVIKTNTTGGLVFEGITANAFETTFAITDPTADRTITFPDDTGTVALNPLAGTLTFEGATADAFETILNIVDPTSADGNYYLSDLGVGLADANVSFVLSTINSGLNAPGLGTAVWTSVDSVVFEGTTADASEAVLDVADPTGDTIWRLPVAAAGTYSIMSSTLATNALDIANSVTGASNGLVFEGTADGFEITLSAVDATADATLSLPNFGVSGSIMASTLTTNTVDAANSIWFASNAAVLEGATADGFEITISPVDPTADATFSLPNLAVNGAFVMSTLTTNNIDAANSVWLASNSILLEGATADAFETTIAPADVTADRTLTTPNATGTIQVSEASTTVALVGDAQNVTPGHNTVIQFTSDDGTATNRTAVLVTTGAITGGIYVLIGPASNQMEIADSGTAVLSATWSPTTGDTLTLIYNGTEFIEIARANN